VAQYKQKWLSPGVRMKTLGTQNNNFTIDISEEEEEELNDH
jgi:hypothetical protein